MQRFVFLANLLLICVSASGQTVTRVNLDSNGNQVDFSSHDVSVSPDGRFIAFESFATYQDPADQNGKVDIYVRDLQNGTTVCASLGANGLTGDREAVDPSISADGRYVTFVSFSALVPQDLNPGEDIYLRDLQLGVTSLISAAPNGESTQGTARTPAISADGRIVVFQSDAVDLVPGGGPRGHIYAYEVQTGQLTRVSVSTQGVPGDYYSSQPAISANGRFVSFESVSTNLVPNDTNAWVDVFRHDRQTGETIRVSLSASGGNANGHSLSSSLSADGTKVAFESEATDLVPGDTNDMMDVFVRDLTAGTSKRVSISSTGEQVNFGNDYEPVISGNGRFVAFQTSGTNLVPNDQNGLQDVFVHDVLTGETLRASADAAGNEGNEGGLMAALTYDGRIVAFESRSSNLIPGDTNAVKDIFFRDLVRHELVGVPQPQSPVHFELSEALGEGGSHVLVLLSCSGTAGFPLPGGGTVPLTFDSCTSLGLSASLLFTGTIDSLGNAQTPTVPFPQIPAGTTIYSSAVTIELIGGTFESVTGPVETTSL